MGKSEKDESAEAKILAAARQVFITKGMAGARMQDIADAAGINKALLHYYFRSKEKLFEVIFQEVATELLPRINQVLEADLPLFEKIEKFCGAYIEKVLQNPFLPLFFIDEANKQPDLFLHKIFGQQPPQTGTFLKQVAEEVELGNIRPINPAQLFLNMTSLCLFPFLSKPIWQFISGMDDATFRKFIEQRKTEVPQFIINAIRK